MYQKIINKIDKILDWEIKKLEFWCQVIIKWDLCIIQAAFEWKWFYFWNTKHKLCQQWQTICWPLIQKIIWKPITLFLIIKTLKILLIWNLPKYHDIRLLITEAFDLDLPDDLIEQMKANKELEKFICKIFKI